MERNDSLRVFTNNKGFVFVNGKLQEAKWLCTEFKCDHKEGDFLYYHARTIYQLPNGTTNTLEERDGGYNNAYDSVEKYESSVSAETSYKTLLVLGENKYTDDVLRDIFKGKRRKYTPKYWRFDKHCHAATEETLDLDEFYFDYADNKFHTKNLPEEDIYDSKEEALSYNTYNIVKQDGTEFQRDGINKLLMLDDDQRELVNQLECLMQKLADNDVLLLSDGCDQASAYNLRHIESGILDYSDIPEGYEEADRYGKPFKIDSKFQYWSDDNNLFVLRKNKDNNKQ